MTRRIARLTIVVVVLSLIAPHGATDAQPAAKLWRIGWLDQGPAGNAYFEAFRQGLRDLGWIEGKNITFDAWFAEGKTDRLPELATELVARRGSVGGYQDSTPRGDR